MSGYRQVDGGRIGLMYQRMFIAIVVAIWLGLTVVCVMF